NGYIIRAYESENTRGEGVLTFWQNLKSVSQCSMLEAEEESLPVQRNTVRTFFKPFEIKTLKVLFEN
ncbi:MAG: glycosyl hydrolase-related protein, partial [Treponema sp.]|nr:glycosyl hydrolase-related protein [Treponema sp.]